MPDSAPVNALLQAPLFRGLAESEIRAMVDIAEESVVGKGKWILKEGDEGDALYLVLQGQIEILKNDRAGRPQLLATIGEGGVVGEMSLVSGNSSRSASARAATDLKLLKIPTVRFSGLLRDGAPAALKVIYNLAQVMSRRLLMMDEKVVDMLGGRRKEELVEFQRILTDWSF